MTQNVEHDHGSPWSAANKHVVRSEMMNDSSNPFCAHCREKRRLIPMGEVAWGWESAHEEQCPHNEDNAEASDYHVVDLAAETFRSYAEEMWSASPGSQLDADTDDSDDRGIE